MIGLLPTTTIFLATSPTDLRKAYDGLAVLVRQSLGQRARAASIPRNSEVWRPAGRAAPKIETSSENCPPGSIFGFRTLAEATRSIATAKARWKASRAE